MNGRQWIRALAARFGLSLRRAGAENRFDAMGDALKTLVRMGMVPRLVIDVGANVGQWSSLAAPIFPEARFHLIEPQPACAPALRALVEAHPGWVYHGVAATRTGVEKVQLLGSGTGAWVGGPGETFEEITECPARTLDGLFADPIQREDRPLLKLDVEGHELTVLEGAEEMLRAVEVVVTETHFFDVGGKGLPVFSDLLLALAQRGFELFDIASLSARRRDRRLRMGDLIFVHRSSPLLGDDSWE